MTDAATVAPPPKIDPETLSIWSRPARAIRFRRGAIIAAAAVGSASLMAIAWMALKPQVFRQVAQDSELSQPMARPGSDALAGLPSSYGDAPKLGPPLPGDLGRPILRAQQQAEAAVQPNGIDPAEAARQQQLAELKAARLRTACAGHLPRCTCVHGGGRVRAICRYSRGAFVQLANAKGAVRCRARQWW